MAASIDIITSVDMSVLINAHMNINFKMSTIYENWFETSFKLLTIVRFISSKFSYRIVSKQVSDFKFWENKSIFSKISKLDILHFYKYLAYASFISQMSKMK